LYDGITPLRSGLQFITLHPQHEALTQINCCRKGERAYGSCTYALRKHCVPSPSKGRARA